MGLSNKVEMCPARNNSSLPKISVGYLDVDLQQENIKHIFSTFYHQRHIQHMEICYPGPCGTHITDTTIKQLE